MSKVDPLAVRFKVLLVSICLFKASFALLLTILRSEYSLLSQGCKDDQRDIESV